MKRKFWSLALAILLSFLLLVSLLFSYVVIQLWRGLILENYLTASDILRHGSRTIGTVIEKEYHSEGDDSWNSITYNFSSPSGELLTYVYNVSVFTGLQVGDPIEIAFDTRDPTKNLPAKEGHSPLWVFILESIFGFLGVLSIPVGAGIVLVGKLQKLSCRSG